MGSDQSHGGVRGGYPDGDFSHISDQNPVANFQQKALSMNTTEIQYSDSSLDESDESLAELLTLTREVDADGTIRYLNSAGQRHRRHGPAVILPNGTEYWCQHGDRHRVDGPAVIYPDGTEYWYQHGDRHRTDGPAAIYSDGSEIWYEHGWLWCSPGSLVSD